MPFPVATALLSLLGLGVSGYIWYKQLTAGPVLCIGRGCAAVIRSRYGRLLGLPNGAWGIVYFGGLLVAVVVGEQLPSWRSPVASFGLLVSAVALLLHTYLTYLQMFVLRALCSWCLTSALLTLGIVLVLVTG